MKMDDDAITARPATVTDTRGSDGHRPILMLLTLLLLPMLLFLVYRAVLGDRRDQATMNGRVSQGNASLPTLPTPPPPVRPGQPEASAPAAVPETVHSTTPPANALPASMPPASMPPASVPAALPVLMPKQPTQTNTPPPQRSTLPEGEEGLVEALRQGLLRPASPADIERWKRLWQAANGRAVPASFDEHIRWMDSYVIQKDFTVPAGLAGANAVVFVLEPFAPYPRGDLGHSFLLDLRSGTCRGRICHMAMQ